MDRPIIEIIISQEKMKGNKSLQNFPYQLAMQMEEEQKRVLQWIDAQANMRVEKFAYQEFLVKPEAVMKQLARYLKGDYNWQKAAAEIDMKLYRSKIG